MKKKKKVIGLYSGIVFALLVVFFIVLHPIAISDTDDWVNIQQLRLPIPMIKDWNPIKVFPECFMALNSYAGAYVLYPIIDRYCFSLSVTNGLFICLVLTLYFTEFLLLIDWKYEMTMTKSIMISIIFACLHFWILVKGGSNNEFLFYAYDMTCFYNYILSSIINAALVIHMIRFGGFRLFSTLSKFHKFVLLVWIYFSIFSSLYTSVILIAYIGVELIMMLIADCRNRAFRLQNYCKFNRNNLIIFVIWLLSIAIERTGGRAEGRTSSFGVSLVEGCGFLFGWGARLNLLFFVFAFTTVLLWIVLIREKKWTVLFKYVLAFVLTALYIVLLSAVVDGSYVGRTDVVLPIGFWMLLLLMLMFSKILTTVKNSNAIAVILATASLLGSVYASTTYKEINYSNIPYKQCEAVVEDIIEQVKTAERSGKTVMDLYVPAFDTENNWPYLLYLSQDLTKAMNRHRIVQNRIVIQNTIPSVEMTKKYIHK